MSKKNKIINILSISTAIAIGNINVATAESNSHQSGLNTQGIGNETKFEQNSSSETLLTSTTDFASSTTDSKLNLDNGFFTLIPEQIAQIDNTQDKTQEIIKPAQQPISNTEKLNPSGNPLSFPTQAEEVKVDTQKPITLEQAVEISLNNNKEIEQARLEAASSEEAVKQEKAALFPTFDVTSGINYGNDLFLDSNIQQSIDEDVEEAIANGVPEDVAIANAEDRFTNSSSSSFNFTGGLSLNYNIFTSGSRGASIRAAEKQSRISELNLETIVEQARFETARDYYDLQNSDAQVEIQKAAVEDAQQTLKDAQLLEKAGLGTRFDVLRAEVELAQAEQRLTTAIANQNISRRQLAETLSVSHDTDLATADTIETVGEWNLELPTTIVQAFKNRAELEQFLLQREITQDQKIIALSNIRPTVSASADYNVSDDLEDDFDISDNYSVGLNLQWRLFDGGAARASAKQAEKDGEIAETQFANQRNQIRFAVEQAFFQLKSNQSNIGTATKEVDLAEESLRLARLRFQAGVGTQTDVIEAQTQLTTARGNLLTSITDYNQSYAALTRQVSNTPDNGLQDLP